MKISLRLLPALIALALSSPGFATIHTVTVANFQFAPANVNAQVGDTIKWVWANGTHTTTSESIPSGAAPWDAPITSSSTSFSYVITEAGTYNYVCTIHAPEMAGTITATGSTSVGAAPQAAGMALYPNPATDMLHVSLGKMSGATARITITDMAGRILLQQSVDVSKGADIPTRALPAGQYAIRAQAGADLFTGSFVITR